MASIVCPKCQKQHRVSDSAREFRCGCGAVIEIEYNPPRSEFALLVLFSTITAVLSAISLIGGIMLIASSFSNGPDYALPLGVQVVGASIGGWMFAMIEQAVAFIARRV